MLLLAAESVVVSCELILLKMQLSLLQPPVVSDIAYSYLIFPLLPPAAALRPHAFFRRLPLACQLVNIILNSFYSIKLFRLRLLITEEGLTSSEPYLPDRYSHLAA